MCLLVSVVFFVDGKWLAGGQAEQVALQTGGKVGHAGNDGAGSGLDADTVDGIEAANFIIKLHYIYYKDQFFLFLYLSELFSNCYILQISPPSILSFF